MNKVAQKVLDLQQIFTWLLADSIVEKANAKMLLGIRGVLTPDQWTKLRDRSHGDGGGQGGPAGGQMHGHGPGNGNMNRVEPAPEQ